MPTAKQPARLANRFSIDPSTMSDADILAMVERIKLSAKVETGTVPYPEEDEVEE